MRLRTKLVLTATGVTFAIVVVLSVLFLGELLHQRVEQTYASNEVLAHEVLLMTQDAVVTGLKAHPPVDLSDDALNAAVLDAMRSSDALLSVMNGIVRYSPTVEDVSIVDAHGFTMLSTDPDALDQRESYRTSFARVRDGSVYYQVRQVFGAPRVLDIPAPLDRNGMPFLVVHVGVRSTFLRNSYAPRLRTALWFALLATLASVFAAALLSTVALRPLQKIGEQLERLTLGGGDSGGGAGDEREGDALMGYPALLLDTPSGRGDPIGMVNRTIDRLGREMRSREEGYTALQANLAQMLDNLRDGVLMFAADGRAVMVSDAVAHFLPGADGSVHGPRVEEMIGMRPEEIFLPETALGTAVAAAFARGSHTLAETVTLEDGRQVQISLDRIVDGGFGDEGGGGGHEHTMGTLLTLRDSGFALELEHELEVGRRLAAIGRLTANVGHEVKNPINAMVVHLELLRGKLAGSGDKFDPQSAQRHVEILADEMRRLDRVVETLADFSRPMELDLREYDLRRVIEQVLDLSGAELREHGVRMEFDGSPLPVPVRVDAELMRQALLNLLLNAMQAMHAGGAVRVSVRRERRVAVVEIADDGAGIPEALLPRIFDLYFTTKPKGSGIGLAMTYRIIQLHGGSMEVRSDANPVSPEHGTTFTLRIPISNAPGSELPRSAGGLSVSGPDASDAEVHDVDMGGDGSSPVTATIETKEIV
jgi:signal transduction histidine kinase